MKRTLAVLTGTLVYLICLWIARQHDSMTLSAATEELLKLAAAVAVARVTGDKKTALVVALSFSMVEHVEKVILYGPDNGYWTTIFDRMVMTTPMHAIATWTAFRKPVATPVSIGYHRLFNWLAFEVGVAWMCVTAVYVLGAALLVVSDVGKAKGYITILKSKTANLLQTQKSVQITA